MSKRKTICKSTLPVVYLGSLLGLLLSLVLVAPLPVRAGNIASLQSDPLGEPVPETTNPIPEYIDVVYCTMQEVPLKMDLYVPTSGTGPYPVVVYLHHGSWSSGHKGLAASMPETPLLMEAGFIVASINYRLSPGFKFPAHIEDVKCAIRYLRATANKWNLDPNRIAAWGNSAGGHLAALAGLTNKADGWDVGQYLNQSSQVQAVVDMYGPTDLTDPAFASKAPKMLEDFFGLKKPKLSVIRAASPVYQVTKNAPPFFIIHGNLDDLVPWQQSRKLFNLLKNIGAKPRLTTVLNAGHGLTPVGAPDTTPTRSQVAQSVVNFLLNRLK